MEKAAQTPLEYLYNNHEFCGSWCRRQNAIIEQRVKAKQYYCSKDQHGKLYVQINDLFGEFMSRKCLEECHHGYDTQLNEGLNTAVTMVAPKHKHMVWGGKKFWSAVFEKLDMDMTDGLTIIFGTEG
eukprot:7808635-Ditylum_brightwellii.AAC.1